jgi:predicted transposase
VTKTILVKLSVPQDRIEDLLETFHQFNQACTMVLETAWVGEHKTYNEKEVH